MILALYRRAHHLLLALGLLCGGCTTTGKHWWSPATWASSKPAERVEKAELKVDKVEAKVIREIQSEVAKTDLALAAAPDSRPVEVARRTNANAHALIDQVAGPMTVEDSTALRKLVTDLLSENTEIRAKAEAQQAKAESHIVSLSNELAAANSKLEAANVKLVAAFAKENELADTLRNERAQRVWIIGGGSLLILICGAGWLYVQVATGGIPKAIGGLLKDLDHTDSEKANLIRSLLDPVTNRIEQALIRKHT